MRHANYQTEFIRAAVSRCAAQWGEALALNFSVAVSCETDVLARLVLEVLRKSDTLSWTQPSIVGLVQEGRVTHAIELPSEQEVTDQLGSLTKPVLYLCVGQIPSGLISVRFSLPSMKSLLPSVSTIVTSVLESMCLERYIDSFDGRTMSSLRRIFERRGITLLLDAIIQVVYLAGVQGDETGSMRYLELVMGEADESGLEPITESRPSTLESLLDAIMATHDPYDTLKATLAHHAFVGRRCSQAEASRSLKVSRSTLQSHLNLAERLNVAKLFAHQRGSVVAEKSSGQIPTF